MRRRIFVGKLRRVGGVTVMMDVGLRVRVSMKMAVSVTMMRRVMVQWSSTCAFLRRGSGSV